MKIINSYVFLLKDNSMKENQDGTYTLKLKKSVPLLFKNIFNSTEFNLTLKGLEDNTHRAKKQLKDLFYKIVRGSFSLCVEGYKKTIDYKFICVDSTYYLDIIINDNSKSKVVAFLEHINKKLISENNDITKDYITIISYDFVSECYCNKIYPKLNKFERKFRKLLFLIYTSLFEKEYFESTTSVSLQTKVKSIIQNKNQVYRLQNYFYSLEFGTMQQLLFEKNWTEVEENEIKDFLESNANLSMVSDDELRKFISNIKPKNDWERFFGNKGLNSDLEATMKEIGRLRNLVAHNKLFNKEQYNNLNDMLDKLIKNVSSAIDITETEDFIDINKDRLEKSIKKLRKTFNNTMKSFFEPIISMQEKYKDTFAKIGELAATLSNIHTSSFVSTDVDGDE